MDDHTENKTDVLHIAEQWICSGKRVAIATLIECWGSAPCPVGSHLVIDSEGHFEGSISGGCVEGAVISESETVLKNGIPRILEYGVTNAMAWQVGLSCGGHIRVYLECVNFDKKENSYFSVLKTINQARGNRLPIIHMVNLENHSTDRRHFIIHHKNKISGEMGLIGKQLFRSKKSCVTLIDGTRFFGNLYLPSPRLMVIGAVHISQALVPMARLCGFEVTIIDPRTAFATPERFPDTVLCGKWPETAFLQTAPDRWTAVITLTHDPKIDDQSLMDALQAGCFYVGALGSRKTHAKRCERLREMGIDAAQITHIHAPVGLNIGAISPAEIAIAILGEIIKALRGPKKTWLT